MLTYRKSFSFIALLGALVACSQTVQRPAGSIDDTNLSLEKSEDQAKALVLPQKRRRDTQPNLAVDALLASADAELRKGEYQRAAAQIERAIRVAPNDPRAYFSLAQVHHYQNRKELGRSFLDKAESLALDDKAMIKAIKAFRIKTF